MIIIIFLFVRNLYMTIITSSSQICHEYILILLQKRKYTLLKLFPQNKQSKNREQSFSLARECCFSPRRNIIKSTRIRYEKKPTIFSPRIHLRTLLRLGHLHEFPQKFPAKENASPFLTAIELQVIDE